MQHIAGWRLRLIRPTPFQPHRSTYSQTRDIRRPDKRQRHPACGATCSTPPDGDYAVSAKAAPA
ncbi:hypothetical protein EH164_20515 [Kosakonia sp. CCTCC M2018092]|nr:hypothetical protein EH164_20515 [Kosakonia sp. CCTCC M2018092]